MSAAEKFIELLESDHRYAAEAYTFVYDALDFSIKHVVPPSRRGKGQHVSGPELLEGIRRYAIEQFGCLVRPVFESWGVRATDDFGEIVFNLVAHDLMGKQESDHLQDFHAVYSFDEVFDVTPMFHYSKDEEEWVANYVTRKDIARMRA
jgi:uncharacterized repeat protein (TIGR04138 family)